MRHRMCVAGAVFLASLLLSSGTYAQLGKPHAGQQFTAALIPLHANFGNGLFDKRMPAGAKSVR